MKEREESNKRNDQSTGHRLQSRGRTLGQQPVLDGERGLQGPFVVSNPHLRMSHSVFELGEGPGFMVRSGVVALCV